MRMLCIFVPLVLLIGCAAAPIADTSGKVASGADGVGYVQDALVTIASQPEAALVAPSIRIQANTLGKIKAGLAAASEEQARATEMAKETIAELTAKLSNKSLWLNWFLFAGFCVLTAAGPALVWGVKDARFFALSIFGGAGAVLMLVVRDLSTQLAWIGFGVIVLGLGAALIFAIIWLRSYLLTVTEAIDDAKPAMEKAATGTGAVEVLRNVFAETQKDVQGALDKLRGLDPKERTKE